MRRLMVLALVWFSACGGDDGENGVAPGGTYSCRAAFPGSGTGTPAVCIELSGGTAQDLANNRQQCTAQGNMFASEPCPRTGALGGCRETAPAAGGIITTWYYASGSSTSADIQMLCQGLASIAPPGLTITFVAP